MKNTFQEKFALSILIIYALIILFRAFETALIIYNYGLDFTIICAELFGLAMDILGSSVLIIAYFIVSFLLAKLHVKTLKVFNISLLVCSTFGFFLIIKYFLYQLIPLDIFLYQYSFREIFFTVGTSEVNIFSTAISLFLLLLVALLIAWAFGKLQLSKAGIKFIYFFVLVSLPLFFAINLLAKEKYDNFSINKPIYFIGKSIKYLTMYNETATNKTDDFKKLYPEKEFINKDYPLIHNIIRENELGRYFNNFDVKPNIVVLIVEGLNDDFIHEYKGAMLMPFLNELKDNSLYWHRCFTLGERSFAVVPSILAGLPYGDKGFTLQQRLPRHLSLVSILGSNNYYTSFFYGQAAWMHEKDRFFKHNNIDLIFDNSKFSEKYSKIIVGDDNFFWGYNDKDLFDQSLQVIDTLNRSPRLDIYFTGTSHSPYIINNEAYYSSKLEGLTKQPHQKFYQTYSKYLKSVMFVDDALKDFFNEYKKRADYQNTIFVITGDHPMTEIPIANSLKRYHVPLMIFADKLKGGHKFSQTVSHLDFSETMLSYLSGYLNHIPAISTSLGEQLIPNNKKSPKNIAFMNDNREVVDLLSGDYYLSADKLYFVDSLLNINEIENDFVKSILEEKLKIFNHTNIFVSRENRIISNDDYCEALQHKKIYTNQLADTINITSEYYGLADNIKLTNNNFVFDLSLHISPVKNENISIVYQITNANDSLILWRNIGVGDNKLIQAHIPVNKLLINDSTLNFKSFIWNKDKINFSISDLNILLYSPKTK